MKPGGSRSLSLALALLFAALAGLAFLLGRSPPRGDEVLHGERSAARRTSPPQARALGPRRATWESNPLAGPSSRPVDAEEDLFIAHAIGRAVAAGDRRPLPDAEIRVGAEVVARADEGGWLRATIRMPAALRHSWNLAVPVLVTAPGREAVSVTRSLDRVAPGRFETESVHLGTIELRPGTPLSGRVLDLEGRPVAVAFVLWKPAPDDEAPSPWNLVSDQRSDGEGRFLLPGVPLGPGFLGASSPGFEVAWTSRFAPRPEGETGLSLVLRPLADKIRVEVVVRGPDGSPEPHAVVTYRNEDLPDFLSCGYGADTASSLADANGDCVIALGRGETYRLSAWLKGNPLPHARIDGFAPETARGPVELRLRERTRLEVRVQDGDGVPIADAEVVTAAVDDFHRPAATTGRDGLARLVLPAEAFELSVKAAGHRKGACGPYAPDEQRTAEGPIVVVLEPAPAVRGRVLLAGEPVAGARVSLHDALAPGRTRPAGGATPADRPFFDARAGSRRRGSTTTDGGGSFVLPAPDPARSAQSQPRFALRVEAGDLPPASRGPFAWNGSETTIEIRLSRGGALHGRVLLPSGRDPAGALVAASDGWGFAHVATVDAGGWYRLENLAPGRWQVRPGLAPLPSLVPLSMRSGDTAPEREAVWDCTVSAGETTRFDLNLLDEGSHVLRGRLVFTDGQRHIGTSGWTVALHEETDGLGRAHQLAWTRLGKDGRFELTLSRGGRLRLAIRGTVVGASESGAGFASSSLRLESPVDLEPGSTDLDVRLEAAWLLVRPAAPGSRARHANVVYSGEAAGLQVRAGLDLRSVRAGTPAVFGPLPAGRGQLTTVHDEPLLALELRPGRENAVDLQGIEPKRR